MIVRAKVIHCALVIGYGHSGRGNAISQQERLLHEPCEPLELVNPPYQPVRDQLGSLPVQLGSVGHQIRPPWG